MPGSCTRLCYKATIHISENYKLTGDGITHAYRRKAKQGKHEVLYRNMFVLGARAVNPGCIIHQGPT